MTVVFCYLSIIGVITVELFMVIFTVVIGFYFGTQANKEQGEMIKRKHRGLRFGAFAISN